MMSVLSLVGCLLLHLYNRYLIHLIDVIIVEDDPYYFLQEGPYTPKSERNAQRGGSEDDDAAAFVASLAPSYLK